MIAQGWMSAANLVTSLRLVLAPFIVAAILNGAHVRAAGLFAAAAFTDFLDGLLARRWHAATRVGQYLDPIADKVLLSSVFVALGIQGSVPVWYVALVVGRDLAILAASAIAMRVSTYSDYTPTVWGKISTLLQVMAAVAVMAANASPYPGLRHFAGAVVLVSALATGWSAIHYTWRGVGYFARR